MSAFLRRQLTDYVEYHRDPMNCALHVVGIVILFLGAVLPLSLLPVTVFGLQLNLGILLAIPVLIYWILLDIPIGLAIAGSAAFLLFTAATIANHASVPVVWAISVVLIVIGVAMQIIGHQVFERRQPALVDNPTHLLLGPVFVMAKLFISLGFRDDLAAVIQQNPGWRAARSMTCVLVTGGSGFIGQHLVAMLVASGRQTRVLDLRPPGRAVTNAQYVKGSVLDRELVDQALEGVDEVYHLAGLPGMWVARKDDFHAVNCRGTEVVISAARKRGVTRLLHCSTESILFRSSPAGGDVEDALLTADDMPGPYTRSKLLAERLAMEAAASGFPVVIGSPTMPIGPHDHNLTPPTAMLRHFLGKRFQFYLDFVLNLVDVRDVAAGLILAMERGKVGHRYILGGESIPLKKLLEYVAAISGRDSLRVPVPGRLAEVTAAILEFMADHVTHNPPSATAEAVRIALRSTALSTERAQRELGYTPRPIKSALRETITYLSDTHAA